MKPPYDTCLTGDIWFDDETEIIYVCDDQWVAVMAVEGIPDPCAPCPEDGFHAGDFLMGAALMLVAIVGWLFYSTKNIHVWPG